MFAAIDWNQVLMKAEMGAVIGAAGGACAGLVAYLTRKSNDNTQSEAEAYERARRYAKSGTAKTTSRRPLSLPILVLIVAGALAVNPALVAPLFPAGAGVSQPSATISDYGRYRDKSPIRVVSYSSASSGVSVVSDRDYVLLEETDQIPCRVGETWGIRIRSSNTSADRPSTVRKEMHHPPIKQPDGSVLTKNVKEFQLPPGAYFDSFFGWYFLKGYEYELVAGEWTIAVFIDDVEVARKVFNIRK